MGVETNGSVINSTREGSERRPGTSRPSGRARAESGLQAAGLPRPGGCRRSWCGVAVGSWRRWGPTNQSSHGADHSYLSASTPARWVDASKGIAQFAQIGSTSLPPQCTRWRNVRRARGRPPTRQRTDADHDPGRKQQGRDMCRCHAVRQACDHASAERDDSQSKCGANRGEPNGLRHKAPADVLRSGAQHEPDAYVASPERNVQRHEAIEACAGEKQC